MGTASKLRRGGISLLCCVTVLLAALSGCGGAGSTEPRGKVYFAYFDTVSYIYSYAGDTEERFESRCSAVSGILEEYHRLFDIYHEYSGVNNLCTVNRLAGGDPVEVDRKLVDFLLYAKKLAELTNGEMNVMLGSVLSLWHDCREQAEEDPENARVPTEAELASADGHTSPELLEIDEDNCTVRITDPEASIDVGAVGKGYAVERAAEWLASDGASGYVLNVGGNIRMTGTKSDGSGWVTGIRDPEGENGEFAATLTLSDCACVTSGSYERYFTVDGTRYHHIIDRDTLYPAAYFASVTVTAPDSGLADALSTALFCMPYDAGLEIIEGLDGVEAVWITADGELFQSSGARAVPVE